MSAEVLRYAAFTADGRGGNPAGVVLDAGPLTDAADARDRPGHRLLRDRLPRPTGGRWVLRFFSPVAEVAFCGHATIATAVALAERTARARLLLTTRAGPVAVDHPASRTVGCVATLTSPPTTTRPVEEPRARRGAGGAALGSASSSTRAIPSTSPTRATSTCPRRAGPRRRSPRLDYDYPALARADGPGALDHRPPLLVRDRDRLPRPEPVPARGRGRGPGHRRRGRGVRRLPARPRLVPVPSPRSSSTRATTWARRAASWSTSPPGSPRRPGHRRAPPRAQRSFPLRRNSLSTPEHPPTRQRKEHAMIQVESLTKRYGDKVAVDDLSFDGRAGARHRLPRTQRRREVHDDADDPRPRPAHRRVGPWSTAGRSPTGRTGCGTSAPCSTPARSRAVGGPFAHLHAAAATIGLGKAPGARGARARRARARSPGNASAAFSLGHAPAARHRPARCSATRRW